MRHLTLLTTGGTIEKTYDEMTGELSNRRSVVRRMLRRLRLEDTTITIVELMTKDSLHMTEDDRTTIVEAARTALAPHPPSPRSADAIIILHGTDTLTLTGERLLRDIPPSTLRVPIILTGAMRPFEMIRSDALQNLTEAIYASTMAAPGVHCSAHGRLLTFPGVKKDRERGTFVNQPS